MSSYYYFFHWTLFLPVMVVGAAAFIRLEPTRTRTRQEKYHYQRHVRQQKTSMSSSSLIATSGRNKYSSNKIHPSYLVLHTMSPTSTTKTTLDDGDENDSRSGASSSPSLSSSSSPFPPLENLPQQKSRLLQDILEDLYPLNQLDQRIATSRTDGYWPYIRDGYDPPSEYVYGEFDLSFLFQVLEKAIEAIRLQQQDGETKITSDDLIFTDLGSGTGRLVLGAAGFSSWKLCRGVELLPGIHEQAISKLESCREGNINNRVERDDSRSRHDTENIQDHHLDYVPTESGLWLSSSSSSSSRTTATGHHHQGKALMDEEKNKDNNDVSEPSLNNVYSLKHPKTNEKIRLSPIEFHCGSFLDPYEFYGDSHILFCFSSCLPMETRMELGKSIGRQCVPGTIIITTEYPLPLHGTIESCPDDDDALPHGDYTMEVLDTITGTNESTGGLSTVYIHRLLSSVGDGMKRYRPIPSLQERAYRAVTYAEERNGGDSIPFLRRVANDMIFAGFPNSWIPKC